MTTAILAGCGTGDQAEDGRRPRVVKLWTHVAGNPEELSLIEKIITDFNASQGEYRVVHEPFPQGDYNEVVVGAVGARNLPCLLDVDGPTMPSWAWANYLTPLDLPRETVDEFLPSTVGRFRDRIYSIGIYDAAMALFARRSVLLRHNIRVPTMDRPWTLAEFDAALAKLKAAGFEYPLNLGTGYDPSEWWTYAYSPMLQSFGGDLIDRSSYRSAGGALNGSAAVAFGQWWQSLFTRGLADPREDADRMDFIRGKTALIWDGNWNAKEVLRVFEDAVFLPPPDLGRGPKIGSASWQWAISAACDQRAGAMAYLRFSLNAKYIAAFAEGVGLIPATDQAAAMTTNYKQGGAMRIFAEYARKYGELRPPTAAYPKISSAFTDALRDITDGVAVKERLDEAVAEIDRKLRSSDNYA